MKQKDLREGMRTVLIDYLDSIGFEEVADACLPQQLNPNRKPDGLDKASMEAYISLESALKSLSRLAVRLDYLDKEIK